LQWPKSIIKQLVATLLLLKDYDFAHGEPTIDSLEFYDKPAHWNFRNTSIGGPLTLVLCNNSRSGVTIKTSNNILRIYCKNEIAERRIKSTPFLPKNRDN